MLSLLKFAVLPHGVLFRERRPGLVILIYHRVGGGTSSDIDLPTLVFERQMAYLRAHHTVVSLDAVAGRSWERDPPAGDLVAVTFDDGYREMYDQVLPVLQRHRIPATVYLATRYVEAQEPFDFGGFAREDRKPLPLSWVQAREMAASGLVSVGAHTHTHADLTRLSEAAARDELERSRRLIEDRIGMTPRHFAYPWGVMTPPLRRLVGEYYATATRGGSAKNPYATLDPLALWRRPVQQSDGFWLFRLRVASYLDGEEALRTLAARFRPAGGARDPSAG